MGAAALTVSFYLRRQMVPGRAPGHPSLLLGLLLVAVLVGSIVLLFPWGPSRLLSVKERDVGARV